MLARNANRINTGRTRNCQLGGYWYHAIRRISIVKVIRKSTNATTTVAVGTISLGKYTLLIRFALLIRLLEASLNPVEKNVHGSMPAKTIRGYGAVPSDGSLAMRPNMMVKMIIVIKGRITAHPTPITVCL